MMGIKLISFAAAIFSWQQPFFRGQLFRADTWMLLTTPEGAAPFDLK